VTLYRGSGGVRYRDRARWQVDHGGDLDLADEEAVDLARSFVERHLHVSWMLTAAEDAIDAGTAHDETVAFHRFLVNAAKYTASRAATQVVREGIEILGGNGTIEDSSVLPLPRLYRDAMVYESWEGTHNVIAQQVLNDSVRLDLLNVVGGRLESFGPLTEAAKHALADGQHALDDRDWGALHFRNVLDRLATELAIAAMQQHGYEQESSNLRRLI
jgi:hypothetical protein